MGPAPSYSSYTDSIDIYVSFQKGGTYLDYLYHILYVSGLLDLVLVFFEPADHLERFQDVNDIVNGNPLPNDVEVKVKGENFGLNVKKKETISADEFDDLFDN